MSTTAKTVDADTNRGGAPMGNRNNLRWGLRAGQLPNGCGHIARERNRLRRFIEDLIVEIKGEIGLLDAALVNSAIRWEVHAMLCGRKMQNAEGLTPMQEVELSREVAKASDNRDKCLKLMGLDQSAITENWVSIYDSPALPHDNAPGKAADATQADRGSFGTGEPGNAATSARKAHNGNGGES